jgi:DNA-directed RNA polymerase specialized sigma24 family protein
MAVCEVAPRVTGSVAVVVPAGPAGPGRRAERPGVRRMAVAKLAGACHEETGKFLRREPARDDFGFELFRRAICERDQSAWEALFAEYRGMVRAWVRRHPAAAAAGEDDEYWVNRAFERFFTAVGPERFGAFPSLAALLRYLKLCAHSVLLDEARAQGGAYVDSLSQHGDEAGEAPDVAGYALGQLAGEDLWAAVQGELQGEEDRLVARLCLVLGLKPREVYRRHPECYADVAEVYRVKRNLLDRLRRSPAILAFIG